MSGFNEVVVSMVKDFKIFTIYPLRKISEWFTDSQVLILTWIF